MAKRDTFLLRIDPRILELLRQWSEDELRSVNGQIEYLLRQSLRQSGRLKPDADSGSQNTRPVEPSEEC